MKKEAPEGLLHRPWELSLMCISVVKHAIHQLVALFGKVVGVGRLVGRSMSLGSH